MAKAKKKKTEKVCATNGYGYILDGDASKWRTLSDERWDIGMIAGGPVALLGAIGHGSRMIMMTSGFNIEWSTFIASMLVGSIGIQWSRWYLAHPKVFTVAAVIPMFPGISAYTAMISAVKISHFGYSEPQMILLLSNFLKASSIVGALSIGLSIPGLWLYRKRPRV